MDILKESPEYVRLSLAAAMTLRFSSGRFYRNAKLYCVNILLTYRDGCSADCAYCGLSKERYGDYENKSFIRVSWPLAKTKLVQERLKRYAPWVRRVCISQITHRKAVEDTEELVSAFYGIHPISVLINPVVVKKQDLIRLKEAGADCVGIAIDCANKKLFLRYRRKHNWDRYWKALTEAVSVFGKGKAGCHLIVGLGEEEREMVETIQQVKDLGAATHLFSFYPEEGSALQDRRPCPVGQFRRVQLARYLIDHNLSRAEKMCFDEDGRITEFGFSDLDRIIEKGTPFQTSGCPGCNRPFSDGPPSDIRSYPFRLNRQDIKRAKRELSLI
jgi:biotin synthase